jgi:hypothetical protein
MKWSGHETVAVFRRYNTIDESDEKEALKKVDYYQHENLPQDSEVKESTVVTFRKKACHYSG